MSKCVIFQPKDLVWNMDFEMKMYEDYGAGVVSDLYQLQTQLVQPVLAIGSHSPDLTFVTGTVDQIWNQLHLGSWKDIGAHWRLAYGWACLYHVRDVIQSPTEIDTCRFISGLSIIQALFVLLLGSVSKDTYAQSMEILDKGLLMCGPHDLKQLHTLMEFVHEQHAQIGPPDHAALPTIVSRVRLNK